MNKKDNKKMKPGVEKENILQAVIVADSFNKNFSPVSSCTAMLSLVNRKVLDYCLDWLNVSSINEVIMFCSPASVNEVRQHLIDKSFLSMDVKILVSEGCYSFGDVMRALDKYAIIRNTFILLTADVIGNINFIPMIEKFKSIQQVDKEITMMLLLKEVGNQRIDLKNNIIIAYNSKNCLVHYEESDSKSIDLAMEVLLEQDFVDIRNDLVNCGVAVCSVAVPPLFSDNFDFHTLNDLIKGLLSEELVQTTVYCQVLDQGQYLAKVNNWPMYQIVSQDIINRWCYPLVLDLSERYSYRKNSIYLKDVKFSKDCKLGFDIVIGNNTNLAMNVSVDRSVIGKSCQIGERVVIENSYVFDNVKIDSGSIIKYSVIGDGCYIKKNCVLNGNCILGPEVILENKTKIENVKLVSAKHSRMKSQTQLSSGAYYYKSADENSDSEDEDILLLITDRKTLPNVLLENYDRESSDSDSDESLVPVLDDVNIFYNEVIDSLTRGFEDKLRCENLILEINSSRYAYNVTVNEVNFNLVKAILKIESAKENPSIKEILQHTLSKLKYFLPLMTNYIKNNCAQWDCLSAVEDVMNFSPNMMPITPKILQFLYDKNILSEDVILKWHSQLSTDESKNLQSTLVPFIKWLKEAEEESDESD